MCCLIVYIPRSENTFVQMYLYVFVFVQIIPKTFTSFHVKLVYRFRVLKDFGHVQFKF